MAWLAHKSHKTSPERHSIELRRGSRLTAARQFYCAACILSLDAIQREFLLQQDFGDFRSPIGDLGHDRHFCCAGMQTEGKARLGCLKGKRLSQNVYGHEFNLYAFVCIKSNEQAGMRRNEATPLFASCPHVCSPRCWKYPRIIQTRIPAQFGPSWILVRIPLGRFLFAFRGA